MNLHLFVSLGFVLVSAYVTKGEITPGTCYVDTGSRLLKHQFDSKTNTPEQCINTCAEKGFDYAGVQYSFQCFCGNDEPPASSIKPISECNANCPGNAKLKCGGTWRMNIYPTADERDKPIPGCSCSDETEETHKGTVGRCLTTYKGDYFCYVNGGAASKCPDKQESIRAAKWWSVKACESYEAPPITG